MSQLCPSSLTAVMAALSIAGVATAGEVRESDLRLFFDPPLESIEPGERKSVEVRVEGVPEPGLAAFQLTIAFDADQLELLDANGQYVDQGIQAFAPLGGSKLCGVIRNSANCPDSPWMLTSTGRVAHGVASIDETEGRATIAYATLGESTPPTGDGVLATFDVVGRSGGRVRLEIIDALLADASEPPTAYPLKRP